MDLSTSSSVLNNGTGDDNIIDCPTFSEQDNLIRLSINFWIGGVLTFVVAIIGFLLNIFSSCLISKHLSRFTIFNHLILVLFLVDGLYLSLEMAHISLRRFGFMERELLILYPKITRPIQKICLTISIFMVVGISDERWVAISNPILHKQEMRSNRFRRMSLSIYIIIIFTGSIVFNIPRFLELNLCWKGWEDCNVNVNYCVLSNR